MFFFCFRWFIRKSFAVFDSRCMSVCSIPAYSLFTIIFFMITWTRNQSITFKLICYAWLSNGFWTNSDFISYFEDSHIVWSNVFFFVFYQPETYRISKVPSINNKTHVMSCQLKYAYEFKNEFNLNLQNIWFSMQIYLQIKW